MRDLGSPNPLDNSASSGQLPPSQEWEEELTLDDPPDEPKKRPPRSAKKKKTDRRKTERRQAARRDAPRRGDDPVRKPAAAAAPSDGPGFALRPDDVRNLLTERLELLEAGLVLHSDGGDLLQGSDFETGVGDIDLLARDSSGAWVVVRVAEPGQGNELVNDMLQLMGWVRKHLADKGQEVRGIVLLESVPENLGYAAAAVADSIEFKLYRMALQLEPVVI